MKNVYVAHSRSFNFKHELYKPLRESSLNKRFNIILPHEYSDGLYSSKHFFEHQCNIMLFEASYPTTGGGIELGWADVYKVPIIALYRKDVELKESVRALAMLSLPYDSSQHMISLLEKTLRA